VTDIRRFDILDSTNEEARRIAATGEKGPLWITAAAQSAGRGRRGRVWISETGNLFTTHLVEIDASLGLCGQLSFGAALAVADVVGGYAPAADVRLKWPNDILLNGSKVAGILLEAAPTGSASRLIVGIGLNLAHYPKDVDYPATSLADAAGIRVTPGDALLRLVAAWDKWYEKWRTGGFAPLREAWLARAEGVGKRVTVRLGTSEIEGVFEDMEQDGAMLVRLDNKDRLRVTSGEIYFGS